MVGDYMLQARLQKIVRGGREGGQTAGQALNHSATHSKHYYGKEILTPIYHILINCNLCCLYVGSLTYQKETQFHINWMTLKWHTIYVWQFIQWNYAVQLVVPKGCWSMGCYIDDLAWFTYWLFLQITGQEKLKHFLCYTYHLCNIIEENRHVTQC